MVRIPAFEALLQGASDDVVPALRRESFKCTRTWKRQFDAIRQAQLAEESSRSKSGSKRKKKSDQGEP